MKRIRTAVLLLTFLLLAGCSSKPAEVPFSAGNETEIISVVSEGPEETAKRTESFSQPLKSQDEKDTDEVMRKDELGEPPAALAEVSTGSDENRTKNDSSSQPVKDQSEDSVPDKSASQEQDVDPGTDEQDQRSKPDPEQESQPVEESEEEDSTPEAEAEPVTESDSGSEPEPAPAFDVDYWISYAKVVAAEKGLNLDSSATECWDDPIRANPDCIYLERDISARLSRYAGDEDITDVWIWYECIGENNCLIYIGYA